MSGQVPDATVEREAFDRLLRELRPKLHRYCARMTGSVVDGEDVVQEALVKAIAAVRGFARLPKSPTTRPFLRWRKESARVSPLTSIASTPATSTPSATCSRTRCGSTSSPSFD